MRGPLPGPPLLVDSVLGPLEEALGRHNAALLTAEPGAGKTTRVPLALLNAPWLKGQRIVMLEPRRLAARAAAAWLAASLGEPLGETAGYRVRLDAKVGPKTRIEVVTEGLLTRKLQSDPELAGIGLVIFDEFHERHLEGDLGLALALDVQRGLRPDLRLLLMSATLETPPLAALLGAPPHLHAEGRSFPVETRARPRDPHARLETEMADAIREALRETGGSLLAFLPGEAEIRRVADLLSVRDLGPAIEIHPLYGALPLDAQERAIRPAPPGRRKIVLATPIAESSLTIEGIGTVIDSGLKRVPRFDARSGMTRLTTMRISLASADQRRGRAGRLGPGICYRLWSAAQERGFAAQDTPDILNADLASLALELAQWGVADPKSLPFLDPPPAAAWRQAVSLLKALDALDASGRITPAGRAMAALPLHPRLAHMVAAGQAEGLGALACDLAALLSERDLLTGPRTADVALRLEALKAKDARATRIRAVAAQLRRIAHIADTGAPSFAQAGRLIAHAYPDRIAQRRGARGRYRLSGGGGAILPETDPLSGEEFLAVAVTDGNPADARIFLAGSLTRDEMEMLFASHIVTRDEVSWNRRSQAVTARRTRMLGALALEEKPLAKADPDQIARALLDGVRALGLAALPWTEAARGLQARVAFLRRTDPDAGWPDLSDPALQETLEDWLLPYLAGLTRRADLDGLDLEVLLKAQLPPALLRSLDRLAPARLAIPSGATAPVDYAGETPILRARLQELFGQNETPRIAGGKVALRIELLSPAGRPVAVTQDLAHFWVHGYPDVRSDLRGRYPKHLWPEDARNAQPPRPGKTR